MQRNGFLAEATDRWMTLGIARDAAGRYNGETSPGVF
jgi:hypothetical protein